MIFLGETPPSGKITWQKPGAYQKTRFMAFAVYSFKSLVFAKQLNVEEETVEYFKQFCSFIANIYTPHFLASSVSIDSSINKLTLFKKFFDYRITDPQLAEAALAVLR